MSVLRGAFLAFAIWAGVHVLISPGLWLSPEGAVPAVLLIGWFDTPSGDAAGWEIVMAAMVLNIWALAEVYVRKNWIALVALPALWGIGLACGLPLYLFLRTAAPR